MRQTRIGFFLDGGDLGDILLPNTSAPHEVAVGEPLRVFIYGDSEDRLVATTHAPLAVAGETKVLRVNETNRTGAFFDWGLPKDLLVPHREQRIPLREGQDYLVHVYVDPASERMVGSTRLHRFIHQKPEQFRPGQAVDLLVGEESDLGFLALIDGDHVGMLYHTEIFQKLLPGERCEGFIKQVRPDGKIDLSLQRNQLATVRDLRDQILDALAEAGGTLRINDKTPPVIIYQRFGVSKKAFKRATGNLYRERKIVINDFGIHLPSTDENK